ncbi:MAG: arginine--tRNA ligase [Nanoarchaeota archaeon]|nr:arginine--tRNA ligase [Nanoarchaeota archaeon]
MKDKIVSLLKKSLPLEKKEIESLLEVPPNSELGDYAFPCFSLAKTFKKNPVEIAKEISLKISSSKEIEKIVSVGPYINFHLNKKLLAQNTLNDILKQKDKYGSSTFGKNKVIVAEYSSTNIAKPFGIGHLRSTIIGNSIANISKFVGFKPIKINYLGDWGTQFGKLITGYKRFGDEKKLKNDPINHLLELYIKVNASSELDSESREWFRKLEEGNKEALQLWKKFKELSLKEFDKIYNLLGVKFDVISSESLYNKKMGVMMSELQNKRLLKESEGAEVVDLEEYGLGVCIIKKSDGTTLYVTRDIAAAIDRYKKYKFNKMFYEVGAEQKLHFRQLFKILELMGHSWAKDCVHIDHGLYLDNDGKKLSTRKGKTVFMSDIINETIDLAKEEIGKREKLSKQELERRAKTIGIAAIIYGDLKTHRSSDMVFDIERFLSFEGNTGPYLLYTYARAKSILRKAKSKPKKLSLSIIDTKEKNLISKLSAFPQAVESAYSHLAPNLIANYVYELAQLFNEFYHSEKVIGSDKESFRISIVESTAQVIKNALSLLGIPVIEKM